MPGSLQCQTCSLYVKSASFPDANTNTLSVRTKSLEPGSVFLPSVVAQDGVLLHPRWTLHPQSEQVQEVPVCSIAPLWHIFAPFGQLYACLSWCSSTVGTQGQLPSFPCLSRWYRRSTRICRAVPHAWYRRSISFPRAGIVKKAATCSTVPGNIQSITLSK